jgi:hypothetical protein
MVCLSVNHFIHSLPDGADKAVVVANRLKIYQHRGAAIRALSEYVGKNQTRFTDHAISSIMMFMSTEVSVFRDDISFSRSIFNKSSYKTQPWLIGVPMRGA